MCATPLNSAQRQEPWRYAGGVKNRRGGYLDHGKGAMALAGLTQKNRSRRFCWRLPAVRVVEPVSCIPSKWRRQDRTRRCWPDQSHRQRSLPSSATLRVRTPTDRMQPRHAGPNACKHSGFVVFWFVCGLAGAKQRLDSSLDGAQGLRIELVARIAPHRTAPSDRCIFWSAGSLLRQINSHRAQQMSIVTNNRPRYSGTLRIEELCKSCTNIS